MDNVQKALSLAYNQTKLILFSPFSLKKWICLVFIAVMAGALAGGGGGGGNFGGGGPRPEARTQNSPDYSQPASTTPKEPSQTNPQATVESEDPYQNNSPDPNKNRQYQEPPKSGNDAPVLLFILIFSICFILILGLMILFSWLNGRFRFIFLHNIIHNEYKIKENWNRYKSLGNSYFRFNLVGTLIILGLFLVFGGLVFAGLYFLGIFEAGFEAVGAGAILYFLILFLAFVLSYFLLIIVFHYIGEFAVPIMARDNQRIGLAFKTLKELVLANRKPFLIYLLAAIILGLVLMTASAILSILILLCSLIILVPLGFLSYFLLGAGTPFFVGLILIFIPSLFLIMGLTFLVNLPFAVYYRAFSLYYLGLVAPQYDLFSQPNLTLNLGNLGNLGSGESLPPSLPPKIPA